MSRFIEDKSNFTIAYGFDPPLQEYFFQVFDNSKDEDEHLVLDRSTNHMVIGKRLSRGRILELMEQYGVGTEEHKQKIALDLPI